MMGKSQILFKYIDHVVGRETKRRGMGERVFT